MPPMAPFSIRPACPEDAPRLIELMRELAALEHVFAGTADELVRWLFADAPIAGCLVAESSGALVGYAVFFRTFSTFLGKPGYWLEDVYVTSDARGNGVGRSLLRHVAALATRDRGRLEWCVLDWNHSAIEFYEKIGAETLNEWRICRLAGESLDRFASC
jgi:GNAT superfamily N-acetyltransferase